MRRSFFAAFVLCLMACQTPKPRDERRVTVHGSFVAGAVSLKSGTIELRGQIGWPQVPISATSPISAP